jgi:radical SAM protein with 4Fe4S-binding SPASM domain
MVDCAGVPEVGLDEWVKALLPRHGKRLPLVGSLEVTYRCNLDCVQCYCNLSPNDQEARARELTLVEIRDIIDQVADEGCLWLLLTGGEPLLRPDFLDIYSYAKKKGMLVTLFTNGTLLNAEIADYLAEWPPRKVEITLHAVTRDTFETATRAAGSFDRCMRGIKLLLERGIRLNLKTTVTTLNRHELWATKEYAKSLGVDYRFDGVLIPRLDGSRAPYTVRLTAEELVGLDQQDQARREAFERFLRHPRAAQLGDDLYVCGAGKRSFHIDPTGRLSLCLMERGHTFDLRRGTFRTAWHEFVPAVRSSRSAGAVKCRTCPIMSLCGQCPSWSYLEHRDLETPVEYLCRLGHLRAEAFGPAYQKEEQ